MHSLHIETAPVSGLDHAILDHDIDLVGELCGEI